MKKRAQAWGIDLFMALIIFIFGLVFFYIYTINFPSAGEEKFSKMIGEGQLITDSLLSEGYPIDWNENNVARVGLLSESKINDTKLERFYLLSLTDYQKTKRLFNILFDYYVDFDEPINIAGNEVTHIGIKSQNPENLVKISRIVIYDNKLKTMNVYIWD